VARAADDRPAPYQHGGRGIEPHPSGGRYVVVGLLWLLVALGLSAFGQVAAWRPPVPQLVLAGLTALVLVAVVARPRFRQWIRALDLRWLVGLHLSRFVGIYFLVLHQAGQLPFAFAVPGGWGDIIVAALALLLLTAGSRLESHRVLVGVWNTLGLIDIVFVVVTATRLALGDPESMSALLRLPLSLLPTFLVPLIIVSHVLVYWRLGARERRAE
jgi:hypothetical protein